MNKVYKIIWSKTKNMYVVVCEYAKTRTKSSTLKTFSKTLTAGVLLNLLGSGFVMPVEAAKVVNTIPVSGYTDNDSIYHATRQNNSSFISYIESVVGYTLDNNQDLDLYVYKDSNGNLKYFLKTVNKAVEPWHENYVVFNTEELTPFNIHIPYRNIYNYQAQDNLTSVILGDGATVAENNSVAIGRNAKVLTENSVALGAGSIANVANVISVGSADNQRRIVNVANGVLDTDAVNMSQLNSVTNELRQNKVHGMGIANVSQESMNYEGGGALGYDSIAIGDAKAAGASSIAMGSNALSTGTNAIAIGTNATATGDSMSIQDVQNLLANNQTIRDNLDTARTAFTNQQAQYNRQREIWEGQNEAYARVQYANQLIAGYQNEIDTVLQPNSTTANANYNTAKNDYETLLNTFSERLNAIKNIDFTQYTTEGGIVDTNSVATDLKASTEEGTDFDYPVSFYKQYVDAYIDYEGNARMFNETASLLSPTKTVNTSKNYTEYNFTANDNWDNIIKCLNNNPQGSAAMAGDNFLTAAGLKNESCPADAFLFAVFKGYLKVDNTTHEIIEINTYRGHSNGDKGDSLNIAYVPRSNNNKSELLNYCRSVTLNDEDYAAKVAALNASFDATEARNQYYMTAMRDSGVFNEEEKQAFNSDLVTYKAIDDARKEMVLNIYGYAHAGYLYEQAVAQYGENSSEALNALTQKTNYKQGILNALSVSDTTKDMIFTYGNTNISNDDVFKLLGGGLLCPVNGDYSIVRTDNAGNKYTNYNYRHYLDYYPDEETVSTGLVRRYMINWYKDKIVDRENLVKYTLEDLADSVDDFLADKREAYQQATTAKNSADSALAAKQAQIVDATPSAEDVAAANAAEASAVQLQQEEARLEADRQALETAKANLDRLELIPTNGESAIAIGGNAVSTGISAVAVGNNALVTGEEAIGIGKDNIISGDKSVSFGSSNSISSSQSVAVGTNNGITGEQAIAIGTGNVVAGSHSGAIGDPNIVNADNSYAVGNNSVLDENASDIFVLGNNVKATGSNSVVLGTNSDGSQDNVVSVGHKATDLNVAGNQYGTELKRRIINVADGVASSDAVTVGQLTTALSSFDTGINFTAGEGLQMSGDSVLSVKRGTNVNVDNSGALSVVGNGSVVSGNTGLINGDILYNEVRVADNGNVIKSNATIAENLSRLDAAVSNVNIKYFGINSPSPNSMNYDGGGAIGYDSIAIGDAKAAGSASVSIGAGSLVTGQNSIAIGTNAMASGDGATREAVDAILTNNQNIRERLDVSRSTYTASKNAYDLQLERFNKQNEAVARVNVANELIAGYQNEIDTTLQPNADTANANYQTAKTNYDTLYNTFAERLNAIKYIDFAPFTENNIVNTNEVAAVLKQQTEEGTDFNYPQSFYKEYVDAYIVSEGQGRQLYLTAQNMHPVVNVSTSSSGVVTQTHTIRINRTQSQTQDGVTASDMMNFLSKAGILQDTGVANPFTDIHFNSRFAVNKNTGVITVNTGLDGGGIDIVSLNGVDFGEANLRNYCKTVALDDATYTSKLATLNTAYETSLANLTTKFNAIRDCGLYEENEKQYVDSALQVMKDCEEYRYNLFKNIFEYSHEQYLYEQAVATDGENSAAALTHLSNKATVKSAITSIIGETEAEKLFTPGNSSSPLFFNGAGVFGKNYTIHYNSAYRNGYLSQDADAFSNDVTGQSELAFHNIAQQKIVNWYIENIVNRENVVSYTLNTLKQSVNEYLGNVQTAYEEATVAKTAADTALANKQQQIAQAMPSQQDIDDANAAEASAVELQQKGDKLEADRVALENAKADLDQLQSIEEAGRGAIAIGDTAVTTGEDAVGMGTNVIVTGENAVAIGKGSIVSGDRTVALGTNNSISKQQSIAIGTNNGITGENSIAIGNNNVISGNNSIAIGNSLNVSDDNVVSIGNRRMTNIAAGTADTDAVNVKQLHDAIQDFEIDTDGVVEQGNAGLISGGTVFNESRISSDGHYVRSANTMAQNLTAIDSVMVGYDSSSHDILTLSGTNGTKLTNLKQGTLSASSTDAINGSQLYAVKQDITGFAEDIQKNSDNIRSLNSSVTSALSSVAASSLLVDTMDVAKADASLNNLTDSGKQILKQYAEDAVQEYMATQQGSNSTSPMAPMMYAENSNTLSVTNAGNGSLHVGEGSYVNGTSSIAIGVGNQVNANNSGAFGDPSIINADESYVLGNDDTINTGATGSFIVGNDGVSDAKGGLLFGSNTKATVEAENGVALGNNAEVSAKNAIALGSGSIANTENTLSIGNSNLKRKIVNVSDGDISQNSSEVVTGAQLFATNEKVQKNADAIEANKQAIEKKADADASNIDVNKWSEKLAMGTVEKGNTGLVNGGTVYNAVNDVANFVLNTSVVKSDGENIYVGQEMGGNVISVSNKDGESRVITGVATNPQDKTSVANVGYVDSVGNAIMNQVHTGMSRLESKTEKVGANAAAMSALMPAPMDGDEKWSFSAAVGNYRSETAAAVGAFFKPQDNVIVNVRGTVGNEENMVGAGVSVALNRGNTPQVSKAQLVRTINAQANEIQGLKAGREADRAEIANMQQMMLRMKQELDALKDSK